MINIPEAIEATKQAVRDAFEDVSSASAAGHMLENHGIKMKSAGGLIILNYDQIRVKWTEPYGHVCRGLILLDDLGGLGLPGRGDLPVVAFGLTKFFNVGETHAPEIVWPAMVPGPFDQFIQPVEILEKLDGTMIQRFWNPVSHEFDYSTRYQLPSELRVNEVVPGKTWRKLLDEASRGLFQPLERNEWGNPDQPHPVYQDPRETWVLELCARENKVVVDYPEPKLVLLARRRRDSFVELPILPDTSTDSDLASPSGKLARPRVWSFDHPEKLAKFLNDNGGPALEGVVLKQTRGVEILRAKDKALKYVHLHRLRGGLTSFGALVEIALSGDHEELTTYFPEYKPVLDRLIREWEGLIQRHEEAYRRILNLETVKKEEWLRNASEPVFLMTDEPEMTQKEFADFVTRYGTYFKDPPEPLEFTSALFKVRAGKCGSIREAFLQARDSAKEDLLKAKVGDVTALLPKGGFE